MKWIKLFEDFTQSFNDKYPKSKWIELTKDDRDIFKYELYKIINSAYSPLGGHVRIKKPESLIEDTNLTFWRAIDIDDDPDADIVVFGQKTQYGIKLSGWGHDGEVDSRKELMKYLAKILKMGGVYIEVSGKPADILLNKFKTPHIDDVNKIQTLFPQSEIEWFGVHPDNSEFGSINGFYRRNLDFNNQTDIEIILGKPNF